MRLSTPTTGSARGGAWLVLATLAGAAIGSLAGSLGMVAGAAVALTLASRGRKPD